jgi:hypothetical protein
MLFNFATPFPQPVVVVKPLSKLKVRLPSAQLFGAVSLQYEDPEEGAGQGL